MKHLVTLALLLLGAGCSSTKVETQQGLDPVQTPGGFCQKWAEAACNPTVVTNCGAANASACITTQQQACKDLLDERGLAGPFVLAKANACIEAVRAAYATASLTPAGKRTVLELGYPCDTLETEATDAGSDAACDATVCRTGGQTCGGIDEACVAGYYCDGTHCIEAPLAGQTCCSGFASCAPETGCEVGLLCEGTEGTQTCVALRPQGASCTMDAQCAQAPVPLLCSSTTANGICVQALPLNANEPVCQKLR